LDGHAIVASLCCKVVFNSPHQAAQALHQKNELGRLRAGYYADLIAVPSEGKVGDVFEEIIGFNEPVSWMMADGPAADNILSLPGFSFLLSFSQF